MSNFAIMHLLAAIAYLAYAVFALLKNRNSRHHQLFSVMMMLFFVDSMSFLVTDVHKGNMIFLRLFITQTFVAETLIPPFFTWFVLVISQKYRLLNNGFFMTALFLVPIFLLVYFFMAPDSVGVYYNSAFGGFIMWKMIYVRLFVILYIFLNAAFALFVVLRYGMNNIDYRVRILSKMVAISGIIIFGYSIFDRLQYLIYNEKIIPSVYHLVSLVGVSFMLYGLVKQKIIVFSSTVLSENILENLTLPVLLVDEKGKIIYHNDILQEITAFRPGEIGGMSIYKLLPNLKMNLKELLNFSNYGIQHIRTNMKDAFDTDTKVILSVRSLSNQSGHFEGLVCTLESVNKPSQGQYDSRNQDERLLNAFAASDKGFWDWDIERGELFFSETACRILDYDPAELASLNFTKWREMLHYEHRDAYFDALNKHLRQQSDSFYMEYKVKRKNGDWIWILDKGRITAFDRTGNPIRMSGVFTDITRVKTVESQLRNYKKKLEDTLKFKNRLIDLLSTDIREPFNTLIGVSQFVTAEEMSQETQKLLENLNIQANHAYQLIDEVLNLAKIDEGRIRKQEKLFAIHEVIDQIGINLSDKIKAKGLMLLHRSNVKLTLNSDPDILRRILEIIVDNAIKFSHKNQAIEVYWERDNEEVTILVRDHGMGMTLDEQRRLFKIDESFINIGTKGERGHGLGLLIAERLASIIDARISFKSSKNEGSEFTLILNAEKLT